MKHLLKSMLPFGPVKMLFCGEENPVALLVSHKAGRRIIKPMRFSQAESALAWCRGHGAVMVYCPATPDRN